MPIHRTLAIAALAAVALLSATPGRAGADEQTPPIAVLTTTTDLRSIVTEVGGDDVSVTCLTKGPEDPHFIEARPSFVKAAADADALVVTGLELEIGYESLLLGDSRNARIQKGRPGYVDASKGILALDVPTGPIDRSQGDVHPYGNPHYLLDPARVKQAAATIASALGVIRPEKSGAFEKRRADFAHRVDVLMWGEAILADQPAERLEARLAEGKLLEYLDRRKLRDKLGGLAARMAPLAGRKVVTYHGNFRYLLDRFHIEETANLEPKPGIAPSPRHIASVLKRMAEDGARVVLYTTYQPEKTAVSIAEQAGGRAVRLAHMPDAIEGTSTYLELLRRDVELLASALEATGKESKR